MKSTLAFLVCFALLSGLSAAADVRTMSLSPDETSLTLVEEATNEITYRVSVGEFSILDVSTEAGEFSRLMIPGFHSSTIVGQPELPQMNRLISIPYGASARVEITSLASRSIPLAELGITSQLLPAQPPLPKNENLDSWPFIYDLASYNVQRVAHETAAVNRLGRLRAVDIGRLEVSPVEYYPNEKFIVVHEELEVRVIFENSDLAGGAELMERTYSPFFSVAYDQMENSRSTHDDHPDRVRDVVTMVIVTHPMFEAQLSDFVDWKIERGFHTILAVTGTPEVGSTSTSIRSYIHNLYNNPAPGVQAPSFVLFVGDVAQMPTFTEGGDESDRPYCCIDSDIVPDIYYGRFSATNSTQLQAMIDKTLEYDQYTMPDPSFLGEVVMTAGYDSGYGAVHGNGQINYGTSHYFNAAHGIYSHTYLYPESQNHSADIVQNVSDGVAYINYTAHGSQTSWSNPSFTQGHINSLQNNGKYCLAVGNCCLTGSYEVSECFGETWLRAANKGGIGYIGASNNTQWDPDYWWGVGSANPIVANPTYAATGLGAYDGMFHDHGEAVTNWYVTNDAVVFCGNLAVMEAGSSSSSTYYWNIYNLSGDPSLSVFYGVPTANPVTHLPTVFTGATELAVSAIPNSYIGVTFNGDLIGSGTVGPSGNFDVELFDPPMTPGQLKLVVMAQNREPYMANIEVMPATGPFVIMNSYGCDDDQAGSSSGNGDGDADSGETIEIPLTLENVGVDVAMNVVATITTLATDVTILDDTESFGSIGAGVIETSPDDFDISIAGDCADGTVITFNLTVVADGEDPWNYLMNFTVGAPELALTAAWIDDSATGNNNGVADPGETFDYNIPIQNLGSENAVNVTMELSSGHSSVIVHQGVAQTAVIPAGNTVELSPVYVIEIAESAPQPMEFPLWLVITADWGYGYTTSYTLPVGGFLDTMENGEGNWTHASGGGSFVDQWHHSSQRNATPGGAWSWKQGSTGSSDYANLCDGCLVSEPITLAETTRLRFQHWIDAEASSAHAGYAYDGGRVEISIDGGAWTVITPEGDYPYLVRAGGTPGPFAAETGFYSGSEDWSEALFILEGVTGNTAQFRFRFGSDGASGGEGWYIDDVAVTGTSALSDTPDEWQSLSLRPVMMNQNRPNPFNAATSISFRIAEDQQIDLQVFDTTGRVVRTLYDGVLEAGNHRLSWDGISNAGAQMPSGVYYTRLKSANGTLTRSMRLLR